MRDINCTALSSLLFKFNDISYSFSCTQQLWEFWLTSQTLFPNFSILRNYQQQCSYTVLQLLILVMNNDFYQQWVLKITCRNCIIIDIFSCKGNGIEFQRQFETRLFFVLLARYLAHHVGSIYIINAVKKLPTDM